MLSLQASHLQVRDAMISARIKIRWFDLRLGSVKPSFWLETRQTKTDSMASEQTLSFIDDGKGFVRPLSFPSQITLSK
jgi:hypothetical protein